MKEDPDFNIYFVGLIEKLPCLYDYGHQDYCQKDVQDAAWETVGKGVAMTVQECKERWKNIRGCFTRHLKTVNTPTGSGYRNKMPYYLAAYLNFILPFLKSRKSRAQGRLPEQPQDNEDSIPDNEIQETTIEQDIHPNQTQDSFESDDFGTPAKKIKPDPEFCSVSVDYQQTKEETTTISKKLTDDPDQAFFISVLPDMKAMNDDQKRRFKIGILTLAGDILSENKPIVSPALSSECHSNGVLPANHFC